MRFGMSDELHDSLVGHTSHLDDFFAEFSWAFLNFAGKHHLQVDKYWHDMPSWRFSFRHPKGGAASLEVFREQETQVSVVAYWWMDDYDQGTRNGRTYRSELLTVDSAEMADLIEETLRKLVSWPLNHLDRCKYRTGRMWKRGFTKEQFELQVDNYPSLKPYSVQGM